MGSFALPAPAAAILDRLEGAGYETWAVGGCVRDSLLGLCPQDWDLCTAAVPGEMQRVFSGWKVIPTGLRHGTVTVHLAGQNWEVTSYRADGSYSDHRRPDSVRTAAFLGRRVQCPLCFSRRFSWRSRKRRASSASRASRERTRRSALFSSR